MLLKFNLFDLFYLSFVQLILSTVLVLSPARGIGTRFRWTGSRVTEVLVGGVGAAAISAVACVLTHELWGRPIGGLETAAYLLVIASVVVIALQPDLNFVGQVFYASYPAAAFTFIVYAAFIAVVATHSILETLTASLVILLDLGAFVVWISNINYVSDVLCRTRRSRPLPRPIPAISRSCRCTSRPTTSLLSCSSRRSRRSSGSTTRTSRWSSSTTTPRIRPCGAR